MRLTEDLLDRLISSSSAESYLAEAESSSDVTDRELPAYLNKLLALRGMRRSEVVRKSSLNATVVYDIFAGKSKPGRDHAIMLAFGLGCSLRETQRLLRMAGHSELWCKIRRDAILIWCIEHGYDRVATDDELYRLGEKTLLTTGALR